MKKYAKVLMRLTVWSLVFLATSMATKVSAQQAYDDKIVVKNGDTVAGYGPIQDLGQGPSINDGGKISFIGRNQPTISYGRVSWLMMKRFSRLPPPWEGINEQAAIRVVTPWDETSKKGIFEYYIFVEQWRLHDET